MNPILKNSFPGLTHLFATIQLRGFIITTFLLAPCYQTYASDIRHVETYSISPQNSPRLNTQAFKALLADFHQNEIRIIFPAGRFEFALDSSYRGCWRILHRCTELLLALSS